MFSEMSGEQIFFFFVATLLAMGIHEAMHAFTSHWLGDTTAKDMGRLTLNPLKHIDLLTTVMLPVFMVLLNLPPFFIAKPVPFNPSRVKYEEFGAALIGIAGPLTNFLLAVLASIIIHISGAAIGTTPFDVLSMFMFVNLAFFVFNMIPFPPLDGSRLLYAFAPEPIQKIMYQIESGGLVSIFAFMFLLYPVVGPIVLDSVTTLYRLLI